VERLRGANVNIGDPEIIARTGWTTADLTRGIDVAGPVGPFDIVTLSIGVNNQYRGLDSKQYRKEFAALVEVAVALAGDRPSHVIVVSIPDWGATPFAGGLDRGAIAKEIDQFNTIKSEETNRVGVAYIDVTGISRKAETEPDLIATDGLHPSEIMYGRWVDRIFRAALAISKSASAS
jgi:lysophospholipase L1-like esterase